MTRDQILKKWAALGTKVAECDQWMRPCYDDELEYGPDPDNILHTHREGWEGTGHFQIWYGDRMFSDAAMHCFLSWAPIDHIVQAAVTELKQSLLDSFWEAWEDAVGAHRLIEELLEARPKILAAKMFGLLETIGEDVRFTEQAVVQRSPEFRAMIAWTSASYSAVPFLLNQAYYMLDYIANEGLEDIETNYIEPDIYQADLLAWLGQTAHNLQYVTKALQDGVLTDAIDLLQHAQYLAIQDAWRSLVQVIKDLLE